MRNWDEEKEHSKRLAPKTVEGCYFVFYIHYRIRAHFLAKYKTWDIKHFVAYKTNAASYVAIYSQFM